MKGFFIKNKITLNENENYEKLNIFNFDEELNSEIKGVFEIYNSKIQLYTNLFSNKINIYKEALLTIDNLELEKKISITKKNLP